MIEKDDLRAAVGAGIMTEAQAASLSALAHSRQGAREHLAQNEEPFELFKGFNEIFIVVGLVILGLGYYATATVFLGFDLLRQSTTIAVMAIAAGLIWALSEYFITVRRMVAPAIALSIGWALNAAAGFTAYFAEPFMIAQESYDSLPLPLILTVLALFAHWWRFRVPFALALVALGTFAVAMVLAANQAGTPRNLEDLFLLSAGGPFAWITLALGVVVFIAAMWFDMSDPHRVTRRSANGFWLHVIAAPAMVNTIALTLLESDARFMLALALGLFAIVAVIIDRRSFLIAAIGYSVVLTYIINDGEGGALTVLGLGVFLVFLGAKWERLRSALVRLFAPVLPIHRLPPTV